MAGQWYGRGLDNIEEQSDYWTSADIRAALVQAPVSTPLQPNNETIRNFLDEGNTLVTGATDIQITNRLPANWEASGSIQNHLAFGWNGKITMGAPQSGTFIGGVLFYDGLATDPDNANLIWFHDKPTTAQGGDIEYGADGNNWLGLFGARQNDAGKCGRGAMRSITSQAGEWNGVNVVGYSLVTDGDWALNGVGEIFLDDFRDLQYATATEPGGAAFRTRTQGQRGLAAYSRGTQNFPFPLLQSNEIRFEYDNGLVAGETIIAVIEYIWTGSTATSTILRWDAQVPNITIQANQDLIYSNVHNESENTRLMLV